MWIGIVVLCTFLFAALAALGFSILAAREGKWHVFGALLVPAIGLGAPIIVLVGPTIWLFLFGNGDLKDLPSQAQQVQPAKLETLFADTTHSGKVYRNGTWIAFTEHYTDTTLKGSGGPKDKPDSMTWRGTWKVDGDKVCLDVGAGTPATCSRVFRLGDGYVSVNDRDEIRSRFDVTQQAATTDNG